MNDSGFVARSGQRSSLRIINIMIWRFQVFLVYPENDPRRFHHIVAHAVSRHPRNSVFSHRKPILSASAPPASEPRSFSRRPRITRMRRRSETEENEGNPNSSEETLFSLLSSVQVCSGRCPRQSSRRRGARSPHRQDACATIGAPTVVIPPWENIVPNRSARSSC
jgi:hypothetical protein